MKRSVFAPCLLLAALLLAACNLPTNASGSFAARTSLPTLTPSATAVSLTLADATATPTATTAVAVAAVSGGVSERSQQRIDQWRGRVRRRGGRPALRDPHGLAGATPSCTATRCPASRAGRVAPPRSWPPPTAWPIPTCWSRARCCACRASRCRPPRSRRFSRYPPPGEYGSLTAAPLQNVEALPGGAQRLIVGAGTTITVRWLNFPPGNLTQAEIVYIPANQTQSAISLSIDTNLADGVTAVWTVPANADGRLLASAPLPGQNHEFVYSPEVWVRAAAPLPTPVPAPGTYGTLRVVPALAAESFDGTTRYRVQAGDNVSAIWEGFPAGLIQIEIVYIPLDQTLPAVSLGIDQNPADGVSLAWSVPAGANGQLLASSRLPGQNHDIVYSPAIWVIDVNAQP